MFATYGNFVPIKFHILRWSISQEVRSHAEMEATCLMKRRARGSISPRSSEGRPTPPTSHLSRNDLLNNVWCWRTIFQLYSPNVFAPLRTTLVPKLEPNLTLILQLVHDKVLNFVPIKLTPSLEKPQSILTLSQQTRIMIVRWKDPPVNFGLIQYVLTSADFVPRKLPLAINSAVCNPQKPTSYRSTCHLKGYLNIFFRNLLLLRKGLNVRWKGPRVYIAKQSRKRFDPRRPRTDPVATCASLDNFRNQGRTYQTDTISWNTSICFEH